jgi:phosphoribosyl-dephospho-CoA transferase
VSLPRPHDLLRIAAVDDLLRIAAVDDLLRIAAVKPLCRDAPAWLAPALRAAPWVVVRRGRCAPDRVPVGIRGAHRRQRHATEISIDMIAETLSPPDLLGRVDTLSDLIGPDLPAARALRAAQLLVSPLLAPTGLRWGPGGSVGFTLATGVCAITANSDLDLVLTAHHMPSRPMLTAVRDALRPLPARVDAQLNLPIGGIAIDDLLSGADRVLVRTADGPVLTHVTALW